MTILASLERHDRSMERHRTRYNNLDISSQFIETAKSAFSRLIIISLLPPKISPQMEAIFSEATAKFGSNSKILTRPHVTALSVEGILGLAVAKQAKIEYEKKNRDRFLAWANVRRGIKDANQFLFESEIARLHPDSAADLGYSESLRAARAGETNTIAEQSEVEKRFTQQIEDLRLLRIGDPTGERLLTLFVANYPKKAASEGLIVPLAVEAATQAQSLYSDLFPATAGFLPDEIIV